jgi:hypothetical protein
MISFKDFLAEAFAKRGFEYEKKVQALLTKAGIAPKNVTVAGSGHGADAYVISKDGVPYGIEVKLDKGVFAGQKNCVYDIKTKEAKWSPPTNELTDFYDEIDLLNGVIIPKSADQVAKQVELINAWFEKNKINKKITGFPATMTNLEYTLFRNSTPTYKPELNKEPVTAEAIFKNYTAKEVYYMQVGGGSGFYYLEEDPLNLKDYGVTQFNPTSVRVRSRLKWGGSTLKESEYREPKAQKASTISFNNGLIISGLPETGQDLDVDITFLKKALGYIE